MVPEPSSSPPRKNHILQLDCELEHKHKVLREKRKFNFIKNLNLSCSKPTIT